MYKLVALWSAPKTEDADAFEKAYLGVHCPKARALPNLSGLETVRIGDGLDDSVIAVGGVKQHIQSSGYIRIFISPDPKRVQHLALALLATFGIYIPGAPDAPQPSGGRIVTLPTVL